MKVPRRRGWGRGSQSGLGLEEVLRRGYKDSTSLRWDLSLHSQREWKEGREERTQKVLRQGEELRRGWSLNQFRITYQTVGRG